MPGLAQGIHVFYPAETAIGYAYYDGNVWSGGITLKVEPVLGGPGWETWGKYVQHMPTYPPSVQRGIAAIYHESAAYVFATGSDNGLHVSVFYGGDDNIQYIGQVSGVTTTDQVAVLRIDGNIAIYYKDAGSINNGGLATTTVQLSGQSLSTVSGPQGITSMGQPTAWGPAAVVRNGAVNLIYGDNATSGLHAAWWDGSGWVNFDPAAAYTGYSPAAILVDDDIFALYHGLKTRGLYVDVSDPSGNWTQSVANPQNSSAQDMIVGAGPGLCMYGGRLFALFQGSGNQLCCQIYMGKQWLFREPVVVPDGSGNALVSNLWWGPSPIAVEAA